MSKRASWIPHHLPPLQVESKEKKKRVNQNKRKKGSIKTKEKKTNQNNKTKGPMKTMTKDKNLHSLTLDRLD